MACNLQKIDRRTVGARISDVASNSGAATGNRVRASLSALFSWAMRQGLCDGNPVAGTHRAAGAARARVLSDDELKIIWDALGSDDYSAIIKLLILTGCRREEVGSLCLVRGHWRSDRTAAAANQEQSRASHSDRTGCARHSRRPRA